MSDTPTVETASVRKRPELPAAIVLTPKAADKLAELYAADPGRGTLRVSVNSKGCSGKSYDMSWVIEQGSGDEMVTVHGVSLLIDRKATLFLIGSTMDWTETTLSRGFAFSNPNETGRCGCGESFSV